MGEANFYYFTCLKFIFLSFHPNKTPNFLSNTYFTNIRRDAISHASYHADDGNSCGRHRIYSFIQRFSLNLFVGDEEIINWQTFRRFLPSSHSDLRFVVFLVHGDDASPILLLLPSRDAQWFRRMRLRPEER